MSRSLSYEKTVLPMPPAYYAYYTGVAHPWAQLHRDILGVVQLQPGNGAACVCHKRERQGE